MSFPAETTICTKAIKPRESKEQNLEKNIKYFAIKSTLRIYETTKVHMTLGPQKFGSQQLNWNYVLIVL